MGKFMLKAASGLTLMRLLFMKGKIKLAAYN
jgi:hypothetical protein